MGASAFKAGYSPIMFDADADAADLGFPGLVAVDEEDVDEKHSKLACFDLERDGFGSVTLGSELTFDVIISYVRSIFHESRPYGVRIDVAFSIGCGYPSKGIVDSVFNRRILNV